MRKIVVPILLLFLTLSLAMSALQVSAYETEDWRADLKDGDGDEFVVNLGLSDYYFSGATEIEAVQAAASWVDKNIEYASDPEGKDVWTSSDQTYGKGKGDCEDQAILLCALLRFHTQGGISADRVWVIIGFLTEPGMGVYAGHAWVGYKAPKGGVFYIEPQLGLLFKGNPPGYGGHMLRFNDLWVKGGGPYLAGPD